MAMAAMEDSGSERGPARQQETGGSGELHAGSGRGRRKGGDGEGKRRRDGKAAPAMVTRGGEGAQRRRKPVAKAWIEGLLPSTGCGSEEARGACGRRQRSGLARASDGLRGPAAKWGGAVPCGARTPSPTSVLPPSPRSKRNEAWSATLLPDGPSSALLQLCESPILLLPVSSPFRPPGFEASPTPPRPSSGSVRRTPSPVRRRRADASGAVGLQCLAPLFGERPAAILPVPTPTAKPPRAPAARRKTLAGVTISEVGGALSLHKTWVAARPKATPMARAAEILVCRSLGIP
ncbi:uncharacterized protein LOC125506713 [Triticum urartu]|uniref:uncharacterized protein LOC125506711 n=1 Tax=Triticum urartu TaxID=4572 RepID=UPI0020441862|nr:uncharacterized protein LOC125506711 [Triticum urartu]XP_048527412.1 uncharacterized protein LOC125506713 [Triticum urartu]